MRNQFFTEGTDEYQPNQSDMRYPIHSIDDDDEFSEAELEALDMSRERKRFASNMFGSDFDLSDIADNKDETMRILQEKSFRGLYLRL